MKIYSWYAGELRSAEVTETAKQYKTLGRSAGLAFGCRTRFSKDEYATTEDEALRRGKNRLRETVKNLSRKTIEANEEIAAIEAEIIAQQATA